MSSFLHWNMFDDTRIISIWDVQDCILVRFPSHHISSGFSRAYQNRNMETQMCKAHGKVVIPHRSRQERPQANQNLRRSPRCQHYFQAYCIWVKLTGSLSPKVFLMESYTHCCASGNAPSKPIVAERVFAVVSVLRINLYGCIKYKHCSPCPANVYEYMYL